MNICIVSPHLDDAILSCGVLMQRRAAAGDKVFVLNVCSAGTNAANRRREDEAAQRRIGAEPFYLDELDAPDRDPGYAPLEKLFFAAPEESFVAHIAARIAAFFGERKIAAAWFPLAAGTHVDHRAVFEAGRRMSKIPVRFYEDRPYILWPGVLRGRMNQIGCAAELTSGAGQEPTAAGMAASAGEFHYHAHFVPSGPYRAKTLPLYTAALKPPAAPRLRAAGETLVASAAELEKLYASLALYDSQMHYIYRDYANFLADSSAYEQAASGRTVYAERSWVLEAA